VAFGHEGSKEENIVTEERAGKKKGTIRTDFHGLSELLAKNLYPQEDMFVHELLQNAHDSIIRRETLEKASPVGAIGIIADRAAKKISFRDNGAGMTEQEIVDHLSTIGRAGTGELRQQLQKMDRTSAQKLIGQFGIFILSSFVVAERLVMETRSLVDGKSGIRWTFSGGPDYDLEFIKKKELGTTVTLYLKPEYIGMTNPVILQEAVHKYADFLPFPIYVNDHGPVNTIQAPWHRSYKSDADRKNAYRAWVSCRFPDIPLEVIPVEMEAPHPVKGVLYIPDGHIPSIDMLGMVDIYQDRAFIRHNDLNMLPSWAKFVRGVIDSPALAFTAARNVEQEDTVRHEIRNALGRLIIDALQRLAKEDNVRFRRLMEWHHYYIKSMAVQFDDLLETIADTVIFEVNFPNPRDKGRSLQKMTIPEYLKLQKDTDDDGRKVIYYFSEDDAGPQFYRLYQAKRLRALNADRGVEEQFLEKYAEKHYQDVTMQRVAVSEGEVIFEPLSDIERDQNGDRDYRRCTLLYATLPDQEMTILDLIPVENEDFDDLYHQARGLYEASRFADAAVLYERALQAHGGTEENRLRAKFWLGDCFRMLGRYTEALAHYDEVYMAARDRDEFLTYYSYSFQIMVLRLIQETEGSNEYYDNLTRRLELIKEGLRWLQNIGREKWRHTLLYEQAFALASLGETERALDAAEEAYSVNKMFSSGPGYYLGVYATQVAMYSRLLGQYERGLQVLDEVEGSNMASCTGVQVLTEHIRLLRAGKPQQLVKALDAAQRVVRLVEEIQRPRIKLFANAELAYSAIAACSFVEAFDALRMVYRIALKDETFDRPFLLREAQSTLRKTRKALYRKDDEAARKLYRTVPKWLKETKKALETSKK
jgi:HSP90 family molecular chaperone